MPEELKCDNWECELAAEYTSPDGKMHLCDTHYRCARKLAGLTTRPSNEPCRIHEAEQGRERPRLSFAGGSEEAELVGRAVERMRFRAPSQSARFCT